MKTLILLFIMMHVFVCFPQSEMEKFYTYFKIPQDQRKQYDSVYNLVEQRRSAFSKEYRAYKEKNESAEGFRFDWSSYEKEILSSLKKQLPTPLRHLVYYSYFDLGYGTAGLKLDANTTKKAIKEIKPSSVVWAMDPGLLDAVIKSAGGEEKNSVFIKDLMKQNKDVNLVDYVKKNLSADRALKKGKLLPVFTYRDLMDTTKFLSTADLRGRYYLVDIWATWCKPCIDEFPVLIKQYSEVQDRNIEFISISIDNDAAIAKKFLEGRFSFPWRKGVAIKRKDVLDALMITGIPCTIVIDAKGKILSYGNELRGDNLQSTLRKILFAE